MAAISKLLTHSEREIGQSVILQSMQILRLTESESVQSNALARNLRVKIMQRIALIEIPRRIDEIEIPQSVEELIDSLLSSLSDKVTPLRNI